MIYTLANVQKVEPQIGMLPEPIRMIGVAARVNFKTIYRDSQKLGRLYQHAKPRIQNKREPWAFTAVSKNFGEDGSWEYLMGDVVTSFAQIPEGLTSFEIPVQIYARFTLQPRFVFLWGLALGLLKRYIYTEWLPASDYVANPVEIGDFEYHDQRSLGKKPQIDLYVAVRKKD